MDYPDVPEKVLLDEFRDYVGRHFGAVDRTKGISWKDFDMILKWDSYYTTEISKVISAVIYLLSPTGISTS